MAILYSFLFIIIIMGALGILYVYQYNLLQHSKTKIDQAEVLIDEALRGRYDILTKIDQLFINEIDKKSFFKDLDKLKEENISNFDLDRKLIATNIEIDSLKQKYKELDDSEEIKNLTKKINEYDEKLEVNRDYYNKNIAEYNKLIKTFPTNIIAKICKYNEKLFFDRKDMSDDDYNDFKL